MAILRLFVGVLLALVLATAAGSLLLSQRTDNSANRLSTVMRPAQLSANELIGSYADQSDNVRGYLLTGDPAFLRADSAAQEAAARHQAALRRELVDDPGALGLLREVDDSAHGWRTEFVIPEINAARAQGHAATVPPSYRAGQQSFEALRTRLAALVERIDQISTQESAQTTSMRSVTDDLTLATSALAVVLAGSTILVLRQWLTRPLTSLVADVSEVADGNLGQTVRPRGPRELVATASAVDRMRIRILEQTDQTIQANQRLARYEESERIAHGLHDQVIQRLVGMGMILQSAASRHPELAPEFSDVTHDVGLTIQELRTVLFDLTRVRGSDTGLRQRVLDVVRDSERTLGFPPHVRFDGLIDPVVPDAVATELLPTLRESLSNIARHAHAHSTDVSLAVTDEQLVLRVADDGVGIQPDRASRGYGLSNLRRRAERLGGTCTLSPHPPHGTTVDWQVPLPD